METGPPIEKLTANRSTSGTASIEDQEWREFYIKIQSVPRSKHTPSRL